MSTPTKDRITCHILDTSVGQPAKSVKVKLELLFSNLVPSAATPHHHGHTSGPSRIFESQTDEDGRIKAWLPYSSPTSSGEVPVYTLEDVLDELTGTGASQWVLRFDTGAYFGEGKTFFPEVTVVFRVEEGQHYHVPLLLAPYSYSTYRGS
ncbi:hypothetical protein V8F33_012009 [Rhypophila sp. PSN 637]